MPTVVSVQRFSIPLAASQVSNSATLAAGTVVANCVPFTNGRVVTPSSTQGWQYNAVDTYFVGDTVVVATNNSAVRELMVEVTVVEFDPTAVRVQQIPYQILSGILSDTVTISSVVLANTFAISAWQKSSTSRSNVAAAIRLAFTSTTQLTIDRDGTNGDIDGNAYVVEALAGAFTVQTINSLVSTTSVTDPVPVAVTMNKTLTVSNYKSNSGTGVNGDLCPYIQLLSPTELVIERFSSGGTLEVVTFIVSFALGGAETIQRGLLRQSVEGGTASEDVAITQVDLSRSMAWITASTSFRCGAVGVAGTESIPDARVGITFASNIALRFERSIFGASPTIGRENIYSWEVIEWGTVVVPPIRRVLVRS